MNCISTYQDILHDIFLIHSTLDFKNLRLSLVINHGYLYEISFTIYTIFIYMKYFMKTLGRIFSSRASVRPLTLHEIIQFNLTFPPLSVAELSIPSERMDTKYW